MLYQKIMEKKSEQESYEHSHQQEESGEPWPILLLYFFVFHTYKGEGALH